MSGNSEAKVSFRALDKSGRVLKAFTYMYLPFHNLGKEFLFEHYGIFSYVSAALYEADEINELVHGSGVRTLRRLRDFLHHQGLLDREAHRFIQEGFQYLEFERAVRRGDPYTLGDLLQIVSYRSVDFRLMHRILYRIIGKRFDEAVFSLFAAFETLFEIEDDLGSYAIDVGANTFNTYDLLARLLGKKTQGFLREWLHRLNDDIQRYCSCIDKSAAERFRNILKWYRTQVPPLQIPQPIITE